MVIIRYYDCHNNETDSMQPFALNYR